MRVVAALGGNALLRRGQPMTAANQRANVAVAARALLPIALEHDLVLTHGNGPQVGLLSLQNAAYKPDEEYPLDVLGAETEGMIGYLLEQELGNLLGAGRPMATILTRVEVDPADPAFGHPTKPIGPVYDREEAERHAVEKSWTIAPDGARWRRVVPSPQPRAIVEIGVIDLLVREGVIVVCAGGGGIPVTAGSEGGYIGIEAVIDKDFAGALLATSLHADAFLMLTDVDAAYVDWGTPDARAIRRVSPAALAQWTFAAGSMGPKVEAACRFVNADSGFAVIGSLADAGAMLRGEAGTMVTREAARTEWGTPPLVGAAAT
ncbi:MAG: carbamate kinase [Chloroflexi bacterium RBG_16_72_14]|nr:MAG: carbamate kinase [Chloroflexi bacterium RBG_16_72_14]